MNGPVKIDVEPLTATLAAEICRLGQKCWDESTKVKAESCAFHGERDFLIDPDLEQYQLFEQKRMLVIVTLREGEALRGYAIGVVYKSPHHRKILAGGGDSCYIEPQQRSYAAAVLARFEKEMKARGAAIIGWPVHVKGYLYPLLAATGYVGDDVVMEKKLCAS